MIAGNTDPDRVDMNPASPTSSGLMGRPLWFMLRDWLLSQIEKGSLAEGDRLPSLRELAIQFGISVNTARRAVEDLVDSGHVTARLRSGCFVSYRAAKVAVDEFAGVDVRVNHKVVAMMARAGQGDVMALASAVLGSAYTPTELLSRCVVAVSRNETAGAGFIPPPGDLELRRRIAGLMIRRGVACTAEDVLVTAGDTVAMELALHALGGAGDLVIVENPTYFGILQAIEHVGMRALPIRAGTAGIDLDALASALRGSRPAAIFLNPTLHNPCGFVMPETARRRLVDLAAAAGIGIIEDDVFHDLLPEDSRIPTIKAFSPGEVLYCSSFTKTLAPGYRVGWCLPGRHRAAILAQMHSRNLSVSSLSQVVLAEFLRRGYLQEHLGRLRGRIARSAERFSRLVAEHFPAGTLYIPPPGGFIHWLELPHAVDMEIFHREASALGITTAHGDIFSPVACRGLRICLGRPIDPETLRTLTTLGALARHLADGGRNSRLPHAENL